MHVHSRYSGPCHVPLLKHICLESYNEPVAVYETLKQGGMDLVTITDHDAISAEEELSHFPDFFASEEVTCTLPSGSSNHLGIYNLSVRQHEAVQARRDDSSALAAYLNEQRLFSSVNYVFSALTGRREEEDYLWLRSLHAALEVLNGPILPKANRMAARLARLDGKIEIGGSDSHVMFSLGAAWTEVPGARTKDEFLEGLRLGRCRAAGAHGSYWKLVRAVSGIGIQMLRHEKRAGALAPILLILPIYIAGVIAREMLFAERWRGIVTPVPQPVLEVGG